MGSTRVDGNHNNNSEMEDEFDNCTDDKVCVYETIISVEFMKEQLSDTDNKQTSINNDVTIENENINDRTVVGFSYEEPCNTEHKQGSIHNYISIKEEDMDELTTNDTNDNVCLNETVHSGAYIEQELCGIKDEQGSIQDYLSIKDENLDDLTVDQETKLQTDCMDTKVCVYDTIISGGYIKEEPRDIGNESGSIDNIIDVKGCIECGEECDLYCRKCPMLIRIFDSNIPDETDNTVRQTLPKNFLDICETQSGLGIVALRAISKGVVFGPFKGLDSTKHELMSKWKLKNKKLDVTKDPEQINWMQYIRSADKSSHQNLVPIQYEDGLYYRSESYVNVGDELIVCWDIDSKESETNDMEDSYWAPEVCERLDDAYACTFCCVGYKSICHLKAHNTTCIEKRNESDFCKEIVQCGICKIYLDKKEYADYHMDRCYKSDKKCVFNSCKKRNCGRPLHNGNRPFSCTLCCVKATRKSILQQHMAVHNNDKPFACTLCLYKTARKANLKRHIDIHNGEKLFACTFCPYKATRKSDLKVHIDIHNGEKPFPCTLCPYKATRKSHLRVHMSVHSDDRSFACTLCPYTATTRSNLKAHTGIHNGQKPFECIHCPYKTATKARLRVHMSVHNGNKPFACTLCPYTTTTKSSLKVHTGIHNGQKPFGCILCPYKTARKSDLRVHMSVHSDDRPFACTLCPYTTTTKSSLKVHTRIHNGHKPFGCTLCPYKTTRKSILKQHIAVHNDDRPFACSICPYKATSKSILKQHLANHSDDKPFACTLCPFKATRKSELKQHMPFHNDDKPFACTLCPYKTKYKSYLKKHVTNHNGDKP